MKNVDGLIQYYYQRRISGMSFSEIRHSLREQQHLADEERETILTEVERRELAYYKTRAHQRVAKVLYFTGGPLTAVSLVFLYLHNLQKTGHGLALGLGMLILGCLLLAGAYVYQRNLVSTDFSRLLPFQKRTSS